MQKISRSRSFLAAAVCSLPLAALVAGCSGGAGGGFNFGGNPTLAQAAGDYTGAFSDTNGNLEGTMHFRISPDGSVLGVVQPNPPGPVHFSGTELGTLTNSNVDFSNTSLYNPNTGKLVLNGTLTKDVGGGVMRTISFNCTGNLSKIPFTNVLAATGADNGPDDLTVNVNNPPGTFTCQWGVRQL